MTQRHILIVDDEPLILDVLETGLSGAGFRISRSDASVTALDIFERTDVELLVTDIKMPGPLNGVALAGRMRERKPQLPVIFLSGNLDGLASSGQVEPPSDFLIKPFKLDEAVAMIRRLINDPPA